MKEFQEFASQNRVYVDEETGARIRINCLLGGNDFPVGRMEIVNHILFGKMKISNWKMIKQIVVILHLFADTE